MIFHTLYNEYQGRKLVISGFEGWILLWYGNC